MLHQPYRLSYSLTPHFKTKQGCDPRPFSGAGVDKSSHYTTATITFKPGECCDDPSQMGWINTKPGGGIATRATCGDDDTAAD